MAKKKKPVSIWGIEFDALMEESKNLTATIPTYPVEDGFSVSDSIIVDPTSISMTLYVTNTPVTWLYRHGSSKTRVQSIIDSLESKFLSKQLAKIVTPNAIYTNMGITSISIQNTSETGYSKQITIEAQKVTTTSRQTALIPSSSLKSGTTGAAGGSASTTESNEGKKKSSILYGVASGLGGMLGGS